MILTFPQCRKLEILWRKRNMIWKNEIICKNEKVYYKFLYVKKQNEKVLILNWYVEKRKCEINIFEKENDIL